MNFNLIIFHVSMYVPDTEVLINFKLQQFIDRKTSAFLVDRS